MYSEVYSVTTYNEMLEAKQKKEDACKDYLNKYKSYLITCLCESGLADVKVRHKPTGDTGVLKVELNSDSSIYPYTIKFYPTRKDGLISLKSRFISDLLFWKLEKLKEVLVDKFESAGEISES